MVHHIAPAGRGLQVWTDQTVYQAEIVIFAAPTFLASYIVEGMPPLRDFVYSPWLTANLTLERRPREQGVALAWDNSLYDCPTLGYVVATHQTARAPHDRSVWTLYWALAQGSPAQNRQWLLTQDWPYWQEAILRELSRAHPDIRACVSRLDIMRL